MLMGKSARALGIFEHERGVETNLTHKRERLGMIVELLIMKAAENIRTDSRIGQDAPDSRYTVEIPLAGILAVHELEDLVAAALHRQMDEAAEIRMSGNRLEGLVGHIFRMRSSKADTHVGYCFGYNAQQVSEIELLPTIRIDVLAEEGDLFVTALLQVSHLAEDAVHIA